MAAAVTTTAEGGGGGLLNGHAANGLSGLRGSSGKQDGSSSPGSNSVRDLYALVRAKMLAKGGVVDAGDVEDLCAAIDAIPLADLGIDPDEAAAYSFGCGGGGGGGGGGPASSGSSGDGGGGGRAANSAGGGACGGGDAGPVTRAQQRARLAELRAAGLGGGGGGTGGAAITYLHIHEDELMTIGIFQLPEGARIPLHNHPGMTVFSRLLFGSLHIRAYDWEDGSAADAAAAAAADVEGQEQAPEREREPGGVQQPRPRQGQQKQQPPYADARAQAQQQPRPRPQQGRAHRRQPGKPGAPPPPEPQQQQQQQQQPASSEPAGNDGSDSSSTSSAASCSGGGGGGGVGSRPARLVADRVLAAPTPTSVLFPADGGNIHSFTALSPCAVLDVLTPPYAPACGRDCTYYREVFPPQLVDDAGRPLAPPPDGAARWVRWQQARPAGGGGATREREREQQRHGKGGGSGAAAQQQQAGAPDATRRRPRPESLNGDSAAGGPVGGAPGEGEAGDAPPPQQQAREREQPREEGQQAPRPRGEHPWLAYAGPLPLARGTVVGLEAVPMPSDFVVDRGVYRGRGVHG